MHTVGGTIAIALQQAWLQPQAHPESKWAGLSSLVCTDWSTEFALAGKITVVHRSDGSGTTFRLHQLPLHLFPQPGKARWVGEGSQVARWRGRLKQRRSVRCDQNTPGHRLLKRRLSRGRAKIKSGGRSEQGR